MTNNPVSITDGIDVTIDADVVTIKNGKGSLSHTVHPLISVTREGDALKIAQLSKSKASKALAGTTRALLQNMVTGISKGFERRLEITGVGYRAQVQGRVLNLALGRSHPVNFEIPEAITITTPSPTEIVISGSDKQQVGQIAANIRACRPPEPYKGKGVRYADERIMRKEAKKS